MGRHYWQLENTINIVSYPRAATPYHSSSALDCRCPTEHQPPCPCLDRAPTMHLTARLWVVPPHRSVLAAPYTIILVELHREPLYATSFRSSPPSTSMSSSKLGCSTHRALKSINATLLEPFYHLRQTARGTAPLSVG
jgi:hypothetical protein